MAPALGQKSMRLLFAAAALVLSAAAAFAADPVGSYTGNWKGIWTYAGGRDVGSEIWKRE